ncbi:SufD family Fe-S cluster assembly protein [archaeon]|nr:SufD family Fe-S cluster assembly protein [archaeon]
MFDMLFLDLKSYKLDYNSLALKYKRTFLKLGVDVHSSSIYFLSLKSKSIKINLSEVRNNSVIIFSNCKDLDILETSDFNNFKNRNIIFYFYNSFNVTYVKDFSSEDLVLRNKVIVERSNINFTNLFFDSKKLSYFQENLILSNSQFSENDVLLLSKEQTNKIEIRNLHLSKKVVSSTTIKNVLKDKSFVKYAGLINILKKADFSKAYLETNTMLLSKTARSINIPMLEIVPKNVVATHAATVEEVTLDELFYLGTRGFSKSKAKKFVVFSFLKANISEYLQILKEYISKRIEGKL